MTCYVLSKCPSYSHVAQLAEMNSKNPAEAVFCCASLVGGKLLGI